MEDGLQDIDCEFESILYGLDGIWKYTKSLLSTCLVESGHFEQSVWQEVRTYLHTEALNKVLMSPSINASVLTQL